jgi:hypothetical protein
MAASYSPAPPTQAPLFTGCCIRLDGRLFTGASAGTYSQAPLQAPTPRFTDACAASQPSRLFAAGVCQLARCDAGAMQWCDAGGERRIGGAVVQWRGDAVAQEPTVQELLWG